MQVSKLKRCPGNRLIIETTAVVMALLLGGAAPAVEISLTSLPKVLDPATMVFVEHILVLQSVCQGLVRISQQGRVVSSLADTWKVGKGGTEYIFQLDGKAKFTTTNKPVTPADVAYSLSRQFWPKVGSSVAVYLKDVIVGSSTAQNGMILPGIVAQGTNQVAIRLNGPYPPFLHVLSMPGYCIVPDRSYENSTNLIGTGPMEVAYLGPEGITLKEAHGSNLNDKTANDVHIQSIPTLERALPQIVSGKLDLALGIPLSDVASVALPNGVKLSKSESLATTHFYLNVRYRPFLSRDLRKDLKALIQQAAWEVHDTTGLYEPLGTILPKGIMPPSYYDRSTQAITASQFRNRWSGTLKGQPLKIVVFRKVFDKRVLDRIAFVLKEAGVPAQLERVDEQGLVAAMKDRNYDIIGARFLGNFPDPDGFMEVLNESANFRLGTAPTKALFEARQHVRFLSPPEKRLAAYAVPLRKFEDDAYVITLFRIRLPLIHGAEVVLPDTSYRYQMELWKIKKGKDAYSSESAE